MEIIDYNRGGNNGVLFNHGNGRYSACTAYESNKYFSTQKGAERWLNRRGYTKLNK